MNRQFEEQVSARKPLWLEDFDDWLPRSRTATIDGMMTAPMVMPVLKNLRQVLYPLQFLQDLAKFRAQEL